MLRLIHVSDRHFGRVRDNATIHDQALFRNIYDRYGFATATKFTSWLLVISWMAWNRETGLNNGAISLRHSSLSGAS